MRSMSWGAPTALAYITIGALLTGWSLVGGLYAHRHPFPTSGPYYLGAGGVGTGLVLLAIGLSLGWVARSARQAERLPEDPSRNPR